MGKRKISHFAYFLLFSLFFFFENQIQNDKSETNSSQYSREELTTEDVRRMSSVKLHTTTEEGPMSSWEQIAEEIDIVTIYFCEIFSTNS